MLMFGLVFTWLAPWVGATDPRLTAAFDPTTRQITLTVQELAAAPHELQLVPANLAGIETSEDVDEPGALYLPVPEDAGAARRAAEAENLFFQKPGAADPRDDKGTAIWAYLFYEVYRITRDPAHLAAARRALGWCLRHQQHSDDPHVDGAILNANAMAYIRHRPLTILYSTTFFGLALLEELALPAAAK